MLLINFALDNWAKVTVILMTILIAVIHGSCRCKSTKSKFLDMKNKASNKFDE